MREMETTICSYSTMNVNYPQPRHQPKHELSNEVTREMETICMTVGWSNIAVHYPSLHINSTNMQRNITKIFCQPIKLQSVQLEME